MNLRSYTPAFFYIKLYRIIFLSPYLIYILYCKTTPNKIRDHRLFTLPQSSTAINSKIYPFSTPTFLPFPIISVPPSSSCNLLAPPGWASELFLRLDDLNSPWSFIATNMLMIPNFILLAHQGLLSSNLFIQWTSTLNALQIPQTENVKMKLFLFP